MPAVSRFLRLAAGAWLAFAAAAQAAAPIAGVTAAENMLKGNEGYSGLDASVESAYRVGSVVVEELLKK